LAGQAGYFYDEAKGYMLAAIKSDEKTGMCYEYDAIGISRRLCLQRILPVFTALLQEAKT
jgi:hypothetical protein